MTDEMLKLDNQFCFSIYATSRAITKIYRPYLDKMGITYPQYLVLLVLWEEKSVTLKDLGNKLYLDSGTLTPLLKRMESMALIARQRSAEDERLLCVSITEKGLTLKKEALCIPKNIIQDMNIDIKDLMELKQNIDAILYQLNSKKE